MGDKQPDGAIQVTKPTSTIQAVDSWKSPPQSASSSSDSEDDVEDNSVKNVLLKLYTYLWDNLRMTNDLAAKLYGWKPQLLDEPTFKEITALNDRGKTSSAFQKWHDYASSFYIKETLKEFCKMLEDASNIPKPKLRQVAKKIKKTWKGKQKTQRGFKPDMGDNGPDDAVQVTKPTSTIPDVLKQEIIEHDNYKAVLTNMVAYHIGDHLDALADFLDVKSEDFKFEHPHTENAAVALLKSWAEGNTAGKTPIWSVLLEAMRKSKMAKEAIELETVLTKEPGKGKEEREAQEGSVRTEVKKALERGAVRVEIVKCVTMGPPEAGKTQLKQALLGNFKRIEKSTDASTQATPAVEIIAAGEQKWKTLDLKQLQSAMQTTASKKDLPQRLIHEDPQSNLHKYTQLSNQESIPEDHTPADVVPSHIDDSPHKDSFERIVSTYPSQVTDIDRFRKLKDNVVQAILQSQSSEAGINIHGAKLIYTVDSGGQPSFLDFHPVTATFAATYLLLYNMEEGLDAKPKMTYRKDYPTKDLPKSTQSNLEIVRRSLFTLHHFKERYDEKRKRLTNLWGNKFKPSTYDPPIIIIGTRRKKSTLKEDKERLQSECQRIPSMERVQHSFVNSLDPDREEIKRLQRLVCTNAGTFQFPLSWFQLHLMCLASEFGDVPEHERIRGVFTFSELRTLCSKVGLVSSDDEFKAMVTVFHSLGVFSCPDLDLQEDVEDSETLVFINPGLLFTDVTKILEIPFRDLLKVLDKQSLVDLQQTGELTTEALDDLNISNTLRPSHRGFHERLVRWLEHWGLAAEMEEGKRWFIPSVLPPRSSPFEATSRKNFKPFPLSICFLQESSNDFTFHYLPEGLFPHFIVQLLVKTGYTLLKNKGKDACPPRCRDFMSLIRRRDPCVPEFNVILIDKASHLLVNLTPAKVTLPDEEAYRGAGAILAELIDAVKKANKNLYHHSSNNIAICCSCPCGEFPEDHLAEVLEQCLEIRCLYYTRLESWLDDCNDPLKEVITSFLSHSDSKQDMEDDQPHSAVQVKKPTSTIQAVLKEEIQSVKKSRKRSPLQYGNSSPKRKQSSKDSEKSGVKKSRRRSSHQYGSSSLKKKQSSKISEKSGIKRNRKRSPPHQYGSPSQKRKQLSEDSEESDSTNTSKFFQYKSKKNKSTKSSRNYSLRKRAYSDVSVKDVIRCMKRETLHAGIKKMLTKHHTKLLFDDWELIDEDCRDIILGHLQANRKFDAADRLIDYFKDNHTGEQLLVFCDFLTEVAKDAGWNTQLHKLAKGIEDALDYASTGPSSTSK